MAMVNQGLRLSDLQAGQRVKIHGTPTRPGILVARTISFKEPDEISVIEGPIEGVDQQNHTLRILGLELLVDPDAKILDRSRSEVGLSNLEIGDVAKLKGIRVEQHGFSVESIKLQPIDATPLAEVQGCIESIDASSGLLQAVGVTVVVTDETSINAFPESGSKRKTVSAASNQAAASSEHSEIEVSDYLRMPVSGGPRLTHAAGHAAMTAGAVQTDAIGHLIDAVNAEVLAGLIGVVRQPAYLLAFVSGSPVRNRLQSAQSCWPRIVECLNVDSLAGHLQGAFTKDRIDHSLGRLRRTLDSMLLLSGSRVGPAKLLFRLKAMDERLLTGAGYEAIQQLVGSMARLASECDDESRASLSEANLGKSAPAVRRRFQALLRRFGLPERFAASHQSFDDFVRILQYAGCLHPAVPISDNAALLLADELDTSYELAKRAISLFRFAWLCGEDGAEGVSDFAIKGLVVVPHDEGDMGAANAAAENVLDRAYEAVLKTTGDHLDLVHFREKYPDVRIEFAAQVVAMPKALFDLFVSLEGSDERRIDFLTRYRLGADYFASYLAELGQESLSDLFNDVLFLSAKEGKKRAKRGRLEPFAVNRSMLQAALEQIVARQDEADVSEWSWRLNEIAKCDLVGRIRGIWTIKAGDPRGTGASSGGGDSSPTPPTPLTVGAQALTVKHLAQRVSDYGETPFTVPLRFGQYDLVVRTNSEPMIEKLRDIYRYFVNDAAASSCFGMTIIDAVAPDLGLVSARPSDGSGEDSDDDFCDLPDGRVVWRSSKGILFASGEGIELAILPCVKHGDKVVNFINTRYIQWQLHQSGVLAHASSIRSAGKGVLLTGGASSGKTTLAFRLLDRGLCLVGKDNVIIRRETTGLRMYGTPTPPRVNSGTALKNPRLRSILEAKYVAKLERLSPEELWDVEKKHQVFIEALYGSDQSAIEGAVDAAVVLNWRHEAVATEITRVDLRARTDLLKLLMKDRGRFYRRRAGFDPEPDAEAYLQVLADCPVYEVTGGVNFDRAAEFCVGLL